MPATTAVVMAADEPSPVFATSGRAISWSPGWTFPLLLVMSENGGSDMRLDGVTGSPRISSCKGKSIGQFESCYKGSVREKEKEILIRRREQPRGLGTGKPYSASYLLSKRIEVIATQNRDLQTCANRDFFTQITAEIEFLKQSGLPI